MFKMIYSEVELLLVTTTPQAVVRRCSVEKGVLKNLAKFLGKHLCWFLFTITFQVISLQLY